MAKRLAGAPFLFLLSLERSFFSSQFTLCSRFLSLLSTYAHKGMHTFSHLSPESLFPLFTRSVFLQYKHKQSLILLWTSWKNPVWIYCCKFSLNSLCLISAQRYVHVLQVCSFDSTRNRITQTNHPDPINGINVFSYKSCRCLLIACLHKPYIQNSAGA